MIGYHHHALQTKSTGLTTEVAAFVTFAVGVAVVKGYIVLSIATTIVMVLLLSVKPKLHKWVTTIEPEELYSGIIFLLISAVLLPLLPNTGYGPWDVFNPFELWGMVVLIAGISYVGYFSMKYLGHEKGILFTSFTGSLVSSIAVTVTLGRFSREIEYRDILIVGVLIAAFTASSRVLLWVILFYPALIIEVGKSVFIMIIAIILAAIWMWKTTDNTSPRKKSVDVRNPLQLTTAIQFGGLLAIVILLSEVSKEWFGEPGIYILSLVSGMVDIDSITLSLLRIGDEYSSTIANGVILATIANTLVKGAIFAFWAGFDNARKLLVLLLMIVLSAIPGLLW